MIQKAKKSRQHHSSVDALLKSARRADAAGSGVVKSLSPQQAKKARWSTLGGVINGRVIMPDSPSMTLPELLREAEISLTPSRADGSLTEKTGYSTPRTLKTFWQRDPFVTPAPAGLRARPTSAEASLYIDTDGPRDWMKNDWKLLDACFTDERFASGRDGDMADAGTVDLEDVVQRFVTLMGGEKVIRRMGVSWTRLVPPTLTFNLAAARDLFASYRDDLLARAKALQKKQNNGQVAPPTPVGLRSTRMVPTPIVPEFTPLASRRSFFVSQGRSPLPSAFVFGQADPNRGKIPAMLHAPRYSHLMEEAVSIANGSPAKAITSGSGSIGGSSSGSALTSTDEGASSDSASPPTSLVSEGPSTLETEPQPSPGLRNRVKTYFMSYLPTLSKSGVKPSKSQEDRRPGLPLPPPEVLEKTRGPVHTPLSKPIPKSTHPKSLVNLQPSRIPRLQIRQKQEPKRLVELRPVSPPVEHAQSVRASQARRSSGSSVKDLVRSFEEMESEKSMEMERPRSQASLRGSYRSSADIGSGQLMWRP